MAAGGRGIALDVLDRVLGRGLPLDETFAGHPALPNLAPRERAFARLLVTTTLRRLGQIDALLGQFVLRPPKTRVTNILRLGLAQLLFIGTPPHAALSETVALASGRESYARGLVNAVLRRAAREAGPLIDGQDASRLNLPAWLFERWSETYGEATARAIGEVLLAEPPLDLTVRGEPAELAAELEAEVLAGSTLRRRFGGAIEDLPGYADGRFWVQDVAAALPAQLLGDIRGQAVIDLCAAPGGKTAQLAAAGAAVTAVELSPQRADRLVSNLKRLRLEAEITIADARTWRPAAPVPFVLLDAPCTATGTIRRHPDIAWHKTPAEVIRMSRLQGDLLAAAAAMLAPGGTLVFASCSLQPEEGPILIERTLAAGLPLVRAPVGRAELQGLPGEITPAGEVRTLPCHLAGRGGMDGFFIARLRRAS